LNLSAASLLCSFFFSLFSDVDINAGDTDSRRALHVAAAEGKIEIVKCLLNSGANVNVEDRWGSTPLDDAVLGQHSTLIK
jgi:ankyrin repeat protein